MNGVAKNLHIPSNIFTTNIAVYKLNFYLVLLVLLVETNLEKKQKGKTRKSNTVVVRDGACYVKVRLENVMVKLPVFVVCASLRTITEVNTCTRASASG